MKDAAVEGRQQQGGRRCQRGKDDDQQFNSADWKDSWLQAAIDYYHGQYVVAG